MPQNVGYGVPGSERGPVRTELERRIRDATITPIPLYRVRPTRHGLTLT